MKKTAILLAFLFALCSFFSCAENADDQTMEVTDANIRGFAFSYSVEKDEYSPGETINITATVINASDTDYFYRGSSMGFFPSISLYWTVFGSQKGGVLESEPISLTVDLVEKKIKPGESGSIVYSFIVPEDAECTDYSITLSYGEDSKEFLGVLRIVGDK